MANEVTIPALPCRSIDEIDEFYRMLGFAVTYRQTRPNPYLCVQREAIELHFFGMPDFDPADSYSTCIIQVPDTGALHRSFAAGMRAAHGKLLVSGIPRMTRPRLRQDHATGFTVVDPGGNWIRIFRAPAANGTASPPAAAEAAGAAETDASTGDAAEAADAPTGKLARSLHNAVVLGDSKGDHRQAARILDAALAREGAASPVGRVEALVYRAELAVRLDDGGRADALLAEVRATELTAAGRERLADALANAADLETVRRAPAAR